MAKKKKKLIKRVTVTICFDTDATDDQIHSVATDMLVQTETLEDDFDAKRLWADIIKTEIKEIEE